MDVGLTKAQRGLNSSECLTTLLERYKEFWA